MAVKLIIKTDATGKATVNLPVGTYNYQLTAAPTGYLTQAAPTAVSLADGETKAVAVAVSPNNPGSVTITKKDDSGNIMAGAVFAIARGTTTFKSDATTDGDGKVTIANLAPTTDAYDISEAVAITGYTSQGTVSQTVTGGADTPVPYQNTATGPKGTLNFSTADANYALLAIPNATFEVTLP